MPSVAHVYILLPLEKGLKSEHFWNCKFSAEIGFAGEIEPVAGRGHKSWLYRSNIPNLFIQACDPNTNINYANKYKYKQMTT